MPSFRIEEVPDGYSFKEYAYSMMKSYYTPPQANWGFCFPVKGMSNEAFGEGVEEARKRLYDEHNQGPNFHYVQVVDDDNGAIVAGSGFHIYESNDENPHVKGPFPPMEEIVDWFPEGSDTRKFTARIVGVNLGICRARMRRPHLFVLCLFADLKYRKQGAATMVVDWGVKKADELGLESFLVADTEEAIHMYSKAGYLLVDQVVLDMEIPNPSEEWKACQRKLGKPAGWYNMWRPVGGIHKEGAKYPWEEE